MYMEKSFDTTFNLGYGSVKSPMHKRLNLIDTNKNWMYYMQYMPLHPTYELKYPFLLQRTEISILQYLFQRADGKHFNMFCALGKPQNRVIFCPTKELFWNLFFCTLSIIIHISLWRFYDPVKLCCRLANSFF